MPFLIACRGRRFFEKVALQPHGICNTNLLVGQSKRWPILRGAGLYRTLAMAISCGRIDLEHETNIVRHIDEQLLRLEEET
jgi:hypothetical protein